MFLIRRHTRAAWLAVGCALAWQTLPHCFAAAENDAAHQRAFVIPHTHWEGAVFKTREEYLEEDLQHILMALNLLKKYPEYRFTLDQMCYVRPFLERYPSEVSAFKRFLAEGRLQIVGGTDSMHDNNIPSGESIAHQYLLTKSYFRERLGYEIVTGWAVDTFGHNAQMPQILKLAGMKTYWFSRGARANTPSEILWQGLDGTRIPAFRLPYAYAIAYGMPANELEFGQMLRDRFDALAPFSRGPERVLLDGGDVAEPEEFVIPLIARLNATGLEPFKTQLAVPAEFESAVAQRDEVPVVRGEFNPVFQGIYSSRIELKQTMRELERLLTTAEKLSVLAAATGGTSNPDSIETAWEPVLFNEAHDISSGTIVDKVYDDTMRGYDYARRIAQRELHGSSDSILTRIDTAGVGVPIVVFNSLGWERTDIAQVVVPFSDPRVQAFTLRDAAGDAVPVQVLEIQRNGDGDLLQARVAFLARKIPAMGYSVYHAVPTPESSRSASPGDGFFLDRGPQSEWSNTTYTGAFQRSTIENEFYRASFDLTTGAMTSLVLKDGHWEALASAGNVVGREQDGGDLWELYGAGGANLAAVQKPIGSPRPLVTTWSSDFVGGGASMVGPVFSEFRIEHPFGKGNFVTRVRLYHGLTRIDIHTQLTNEDAFVRYRAIFPTTLSAGIVTSEIPFGAIDRAQDTELPAQNWVDYSNGHRGITVLNRGIPGNNVSSRGEMMLSLMRSAHLGIEDPKMAIPSSDAGLELGKTLSFDYAIIPHAGDWRLAKSWRAGLEFNNPLIVSTTTPHDGALPQRWGLVEISQDNVVLSALKAGENGTAVVRVYEAAGKLSRAVKVSFHASIGQIHEANLIEDEGPTIASTNSAFVIDLKPFEIKTFKLTLGPMREGSR